MQRSETTTTKALFLLTSLFLCGLGACSTPSHSSGVSLMGGMRQQGGQEFEDIELDTPAVFGAAYELKSRAGGFGFEAGGFWAEDTVEVAGIEGESQTLEAFVGMRYDFLPETSAVRPYLGIGGAYLRNEIGSNTSSASIDGNTFGAYAHGGVMFLLTPHVSLGLDLRGVFNSEYEFDGPFFVDGGYAQGSAVLSFSF